MVVQPSQAGVHEAVSPTVPRQARVQAKTQFESGALKDGMGAKESHQIPVTMDLLEHFGPQGRCDELVVVVWIRCGVVEVKGVRVFPRIGNLVT